MRAAEMLAEMLLDEAQAFGIVFGPGVPDHGYWISGANVQGVVNKAVTGLETGKPPVIGAPSQTDDDRAKDNLATLMQKGYSLVVPNGNTAGDIIVYGHNIPELTPKAVEMMQITASTPVLHVHGVEKGKTTRTVAKEAFGIEMTPQEKEAYKQQKANKSFRNYLTPDEQEEFSQMQAQQARNVQQGAARVSAPAAPPSPPPMPAPGTPGGPPAGKPPGKQRRWWRRHSNP